MSYKITCEYCSGSGEAWESYKLLDQGELGIEDFESCFYYPEDCEDLV